MVGPRSLFLLPVLLFHSVCGVDASVGNSEIAPDVGNKVSRIDAEQDPFLSVTVVPEPGAPESALFSTCLTSSRTIDAKFASIEVVPGSDYIRYVPDSYQLSIRLSWETLLGEYPSIFECAQAAYDDNWPMFKYDGVKCKTANKSYWLDDVPHCEEEDSEAVFILSASGEDPCPFPRFFLGNDNSDVPVCAVINENLMTFDEAKNFCLNIFADEELTLFINEYQPLTVEQVIGNFSALGYTTTNLWVGAEQRDPMSWYGTWYGNFDDSDWHGNQPPPRPVPFLKSIAAYMDHESNFKLRAADKSTKAGALCATYAESQNPE